MRQIKTLILLLGVIYALGSCSKDDSKKALQADPLYGLWTDTNRNYCLNISNDTIYYFVDEMDGVEFKTAFQKKDANTLIFTLPENGNGSITLNPETLDLNMVLDFGEGQETYAIPAYDHLDLATTAPNIAATFLYDEDFTTIADTLRSGDFYPILEDKGNYAALALPDGRKGWTSSDKVNVTRSRLSPVFFEREYTQELEDLRGHPDRIEGYSFKKHSDGKISVLFNRRYYNGRAAQEEYYIGELDGIHLNVTHRFNDFNDWDNENMQAATALEEPFEITMVDCLIFPYIETGRRVFHQVQQEY